MQDAAWTKQNPTQDPQADTSSPSLPHLNSNSHCEPNTICLVVTGLHAILHTGKAWGLGGGLLVANAQCVRVLEISVAT